MALTLNAEDGKQMLKVQGALVQALLPFMHNTEAALAAMACVRCARTLARKYPKATRDELVSLLCSFLKGETEDQAMRELLGDTARSFFQ